MVHIRVLDGNSIDKLLWSEDISPEQHSLLVGFQIDLHRANLLGLHAASYDAKVTGAGHDISQIEADHRLKVNQCIKFLVRTAGQQVSSIILDLCLSDKPVPKVPGAGLVHIGCAALMKFRDISRR